MSALDPLTAQAQARVGRVLRMKWRLDHLLGVGGMAAVYAATHRNGARVAVKMLHAELSLEPTIRERFLREGYTANSVEHPGVVMVLDDDVADDGSVFIVMELLQGETLDARWERVGGRMPAQDVLSVADQILDVLAAAHARGVIHRDIKPENVFLTRGGVVKVLDFGIARLLERVGRSNATQAGAALGTPAFMAPEQALGLVDQVDHRVDIWAVGATMFALLTGRLVHEGRTPNEQLVAAATRSAPPLRIVLRDAHPLVAQVVDVALAFDVAQRWRDARFMQEAVREAYAAVCSGPISEVDLERREETVVAAPMPEALIPMQCASPPASTGTVVADAGSMPHRRPSNTASGAAVGRTLADPPRRRGAIAATSAIAIAGAALATVFGTSVIGYGLWQGPNDAAVEAGSNPGATASPAQSGASAPAASAVGQPVAAASSLPGDDAGTRGGSLSIVAVDGFCAVAVDGKAIGRTPLPDWLVDAGSHRVLCSRPGEADRVETVDVSEGGDVKVIFRISGAPPPTSKPPPAKRLPSTTDPLDVRK